MILVSWSPVVFVVVVPCILNACDDDASRVIVVSFDWQLDVQFGQWCTVRTMRRTDGQRFTTRELDTCMKTCNWSQGLRSSVWDITEKDGESEGEVWLRSCFSLCKRDAGSQSVRSADVSPVAYADRGWRFFDRREELVCLMLVLNGNWGNEMDTWSASYVHKGCHLLR